MTRSVTRTRNDSVPVRLHSRCSHLGREASDKERLQKRGQDEQVRGAKPLADYRRIDAQSWVVVPLQKGVVHRIRLGHHRGEVGGRSTLLGLGEGVHRRHEVVRRNPRCRGRGAGSLSRHHVVGSLSREARSHRRCGVDSRTCCR